MIVLLIITHISFTYIMDLYCLRSVFLVFEYCEHDLSVLVRNHGLQHYRHPFKVSEVLCSIFSFYFCLLAMKNVLLDEFLIIRLLSFS